MLVPALRDAYADLSAAADGADLIVAHPVTFVARMVAEERKRPWLSTVLAPTSFFSIHDFPILPPHLASPRSHGGTAGRRARCARSRRR
jgi:hypothetical protein